MENHTYFFQWQVPVDNSNIGRPDQFIDVKAEWDGQTTYGDDMPFAHVCPINMTFLDVLKVSNWNLAYRDIKNTAERHFKSLLQQMKKGQDIEIISKEENPVLTRLNNKHAIAV